MSISLQVTNTARFKVPTRRFFVLAAKKTFGILGNSRPSTRFEISLIFTSPNEIRQLNKQYRGKNKLTDVLSFPRFSSASVRARPAIGGVNPRLLGKVVPRADPDGVIRLGEIAIAPTVARKEAPLFNHSIRTHYLFLFAHGLLHLLGYDHERSRMDEQVMQLIQTRILSSIRYK